MLYAQFLTFLLGLILITVWLHTSVLFYVLHAFAFVISNKSFTRLFLIKVLLKL